MGRAPLVVAGVVLLVLLIVTLICGPDWADYLLGILVFLVWLSSKEYKDFVARMVGWLPQRSSGSRFAGFLGRIRSVFAYSDLSLFLASVILLGVGLSNSFVADVQDLAAKKFLSFDPEMAGFVYLQIYILGYLTLLPLFLACTAYGFYQGVRYGEISFAKLLAAIVLGIFMAVLLSSVAHGGFIGDDNLKLMTEKTSGSLPSGASPMSPMSLVSWGVTILLGFTALAWIFSLLGHLAKRLLLRAATAAAPPE